MYPLSISQPPGYGHIPRLGQSCTPVHGFEILGSDPKKQVHLQGIKHDGSSVRSQGVVMASAQTGRCQWGDPARLPLWCDLGVLGFLILRTLLTSQDYVTSLLFGSLNSCYPSYKFLSSQVNQNPFLSLVIRTLD